MKLFDTDFAMQKPKGEIPHHQTEGEVNPNLPSPDRG